MEDRMTRKSTANQVLLSCIAYSALLGSGMSIGYTAVALPYMQSPDNVFPVDEDQASWIASLGAISTPVGCLLSGHLMDRYGRRVALLLISPPLVMGWLLIGLNPTLYRVYLGRILTGMAAGLCSVPGTVYTAEIVDSSIRGLLITGTSVSTALGILIVYILGALLKSQWQLVALISSGFPTVTTVLVFFFLPESPVWLITKDRIDDASISLMTINHARTPIQVKDELDMLVDRVHCTQQRSLSLSTTLKAFTRPEAYKPLIIMNTFFFFQQITGPFIVLFYAVDVVKSAGITTDPFLVTVLIGLTRLVFTFLATCLSKVIGKRPTAIMSGVGMTLSLMTLACHLYLQQQPSVPDLTSLAVGNETKLVTALENTTQVMTETGVTMSYLPIIMLLFYILSSTIGFLTLPWSMIGEVFPAQVRGIAGGLCTCVAHGLSFVMLKTYPYMKEVLDKHGVFCFFGLMAFLGTLFVIVFLPETEGKTLEEIEMQFVKKGKRPVVRPKEEVELTH